jgi:hypothetical protein
VTPARSVPTDNIYKFASLFGWAIIFAAVLSFVSIYSFNLKEKVQLTDAIATLEAKAERTKLEDDALARRKRLRDAHTANEKHPSNVIGLALGFGLCAARAASPYGTHWCRSATISLHTFRSGP